MSTYIGKCSECGAILAFSDWQFEPGCEGAGAYGYKCPRCEHEAETPIDCTINRD